ncbi:hypothetical protein B0H63DRAFT_544004 [Podospora didyma]|uniref:Uncharacterized protein n=1 Tax=Podospora didyma TaxID=330526 RepID=A0AAE0NQ39_9PEZI|nr:hypothetical protein B0H63DRAFT_544004 [Podospora didyma]
MNAPIAPAPSSARRVPLPVISLESIREEHPQTLRPAVAEGSETAARTIPQRTRTASVDSNGVSPVFSTIENPFTNINFSTATAAAERTPSPQRPDEGEVLLPSQRGWWWWEIGAVALSAISLVCLVVFLVKIDETALESWSQPVEPSFLIAILTTTIKMAILVPIASCINQLKWRYLWRGESTTVEGLQRMEDASRGVWGSVLMLTRITSPRRQTIFIWFFCVVTILAIGIDPSAQQMLGISSRRVVMGSVVPGMARADSYAVAPHNDKKNPAQIDKDLLAFQAAYLQGMSGIVAPPDFRCPSPATECVWPNFDTLGVCGTLTVVNETYTSCEFTIEPSPILNCTYNFPGRIAPKPKGIYITYKVGQPATQTNISVEADGWGEATSAALAFIRAANPRTVVSNSTPPAIETFYITWTWCAKHFSNVTATPDRISSQSFTSAAVKLVPESLFHKETNAISHLDTTTGKVYRISYDAYNSLWVSLEDLSSSARIHNSLNGLMSRTQDLNSVAQNVAEALTNRIRGTVSIPTMALGRAYKKELYYTVRWLWFILPLAEIILTIFLLALCIVINMDTPILKNSINGYFALGILRSRSEEDLTLAGTGGGAVKVGIKAAAEDVVRMTVQRNGRNGLLETVRTST